METANIQTSDKAQTKYDLLAERGYDLARDKVGSPKDEDFLLTLDPKVRDAFVIDLLVGQVNNGGFQQWAENGYGVQLPFLRHALKQVGGELAAEVSDMAEQAIDLVREANEEMNFDDEEYGSCEAIKTLDELTDRFYEIHDELVKQIADHFERAG